MRVGTHPLTSPRFHKQLKSAAGMGNIVKSDEFEIARFQEVN
jgi:hypothetical protein